MGAGCCTGGGHSVARKGPVHSAEQLHMRGPRLRRSPQGPPGHTHPVRPCSVESLFLTALPGEEPLSPSCHCRRRQAQVKNFILSKINACQRTTVWPEKALTLYLRPRGPIPVLHKSKGVLKPPPAHPVWLPRPGGMRPGQSLWWTGGWAQGKGSLSRDVFPSTQLRSNSSLAKRACQAQGHRDTSSWKPLEKVAGAALTAGGREAPR